MRSKNVENKLHTTARQNPSVEKINFYTNFLIMSSYSIAPSIIQIEMLLGRRTKITYIMTKQAVIGGCVRFPFKGRGDIMNYE